MKFILTVTTLFVCICFSAVQAQTIKEIGHLEFSDTLVNFGAVKEEQGVLSHTFKFVNLGPEHFVIEDIDPSCGCITPDYPTDTIHPGEKGEIVLYVDLVNHPGLFNQKVTIKGNASKAPINLYVQGYVTPSPQPLPEWERTSSFKYNTIYLQKNYANFGVVSTKAPVSMEIPVYNSGSQTMIIQTEKMKLPSYVKVILLPTKIEAKQRGVIKVSLNPKDVPALGYFAESVEVLFVSGSTATKIPLVLTATIKDSYTPAEAASVVGPKIQLDKTFIDLGSIKTNEKNTTEVRITNTGAAELTIRSIRTSCSCVEAFADKVTLKPGAYTIMKIVFDTNDRLGTEEKIVTVFSTDAANPIIVVKLKATVIEELPVVTPVGQ